MSALCGWIHARCSDEQAATAAEAMAAACTRGAAGAPPAMLGSAAGAILAVDGRIPVDLQRHGPVLAAVMGEVDFASGELAQLAHERGAARAAAFAFPSLAEGFGLPVLEAMGAGAAVVTSDRSATAEVAGEGAVLVDPHDVGALASALRSLLEAGDGAAELRERAVRRAGDFTWADSARRTLDTYREVLA